MILGTTSKATVAPKGCPSSKAGDKTTQKSTTEKHAVRCCAKDGQSCVSNCGKQTYEDAKKTCQDNNRRLCKETELKKCCGTGCGYDIQSTWIAVEECKSIVKESANEIFSNCILFSYNHKKILLCG